MLRSCSAYRRSFVVTDPKPPVKYHVYMSPAGAEQFAKHITDRETLGVSSEPVPWYYFSIFPDGYKMPEGYIRVTDALKFKMPPLDAAVLAATAGLEQEIDNISKEAAQKVNDLRTRIANIQLIGYTPK